jgi:hypothetical protein
MSAAKLCQVVLEDCRPTKLRILRDEQRLAEGEERVWQLDGVNLAEGTCTGIVWNALSLEDAVRSIPEFCADVEAQLEHLAARRG